MDTHEQTLIFIYINDEQWPFLLLLFCSFRVELMADMLMSSGLLLTSWLRDTMSWLSGLQTTEVS